MSYEIYYTSAPEGLKRGSSGFSTVAATEGIPKALWDRLEALSAYRHHFGVAAAEGGGGSGHNPVSYAHWLLSVTGTTYHVLSRICDSGVDHTQRSNAFAHHLVLEASERAAAGPAWMLQKSGVMEEAWNGKVEALARRERMPQGDSPGRICRAWAALTGDAGWGGALADGFVKSPGKPVCVLFSPGQDVLPLIAETIALLPAAARWNVTFNTYFTSMPTSATCAWRCCLAGTPAAQIGLRYAAGGVVIDLTDRARLGTLTEGPYVTMARTGIVPVSTTPTAAAGARTAVTKPPAKSAPLPPRITLAPRDEEEESEYEFADNREEMNREIDLSFVEEVAPAEKIQRQALPKIVIPREKKRVNTNIRAVDAAIRSAEADADKAAAQRRKQIVWLFFGALGAIAIGVGLVFLAERNSAPPELPPIHREPGALRPLTPAIVAPAVIAESPTGGNGVTTAPIVAPLVTTAPLTDTPVAVTPVEPPVTPAAPKYPESFTLGVMLAKPKPGQGIADSSQVLSLPMADFDPARVTALRLRFPAENGAAAQGGSFSEWAYKEGFEGTVVETPARSMGMPGITLSWKDISGTLDIATITLEQSGTKKPGLSIVWKSGAMVRKPEVGDLMYWLLQSSTLETRHGTGGAEAGQTIAFKGIENQVVDLMQESSPLAVPADLPKDFVVVEPKGADLPTGWTAKWHTTWGDSKEALLTADNASEVIEFRKKTSNDAVEAWFTLQFGPGLKTVESTFAKRQAEAEANSKMTDIDAEIDSLKKQYGNAAYDASDKAKELAKKRADSLALSEAYKEALSGYNDVKDLDVTIGLPGGLRVMTVRFHRTEKPDINQGQ